MLVRIQHIDGTLEPPLSVDDLSPEEVGSLFALPDGRWVQVLGQERSDDGEVVYLVVGEKLPPRSYGATGHEAYVRDASEMRMGSPQYGTLMLDGTRSPSVSTTTHLFGRRTGATWRQLSLTRGVQAR